MNQALIQVRVDRGLKEQTAAIYDAIGIDLPTAIRMFFKRTVMVGGLPFDGKLIMRDNAAQRAFASMRQNLFLKVFFCIFSKKTAGTTTSL